MGVLDMENTDKLVNIRYIPYGKNDKDGGVCILSFKEKDGSNKMLFVGCNVFDKSSISKYRGNCTNIGVIAPKEEEIDIKFIEALYKNTDITVALAYTDMVEGYFRVRLHRQSENFFVVNYLDQNRDMCCDTVEEAYEVAAYFFTNFEFKGEKYPECVVTHYDINDAGEHFLVIVGDICPNQAVSNIVAFANETDAALIFISHRTSSRIRDLCINRPNTYAYDNSTGGCNIQL